MGEGGRDALRADFDESVMLEFHGSKLTSDGEQERSAYNGHFACTCHHPSFCFNQFDDLQRALLREGNVSSADDWHSVLEPIVARCRHFVDNHARLQLFALARSLGNFLRRLALPRSVKHRSLTTLCNRGVIRRALRILPCARHFVPYAGLSLVFCRHRISFLEATNQPLPGA